MFPLASLPNQNPAATDLSLQQQQAILFKTQSPAPHAASFGTQNANLSSFDASNVAAAASLLAPLSCPFVPPMARSNLMGVLPHSQLQLAAGQILNQQLLALQLLRQSWGAPAILPQFQGQLQSLGALAFPQSGAGSCLANNLPQSFNLTGVAPSELPCLPNMAMVSSNRMAAFNSTASLGVDATNSGLLGNNPVTTVGNLNTRVGNARNHRTVNHDQLQNLEPQVHCYEVVGRVIDPMNYPKNRLAKDFRHNKTEMRFQKQQFKSSEIVKINMTTYTGNGDGGQEKRREIKAQAAKSSKPPLTESRRFPIKYTEKEIQQWVKARKMNFPTRAKIEKSLARCKDNNVHADVKSRHQQVNKVLAKQAEFGEVSEVPPGYLLEADKKTGEEVNNTAMLGETDHSPRGFSNKKRGRRRWRKRREKKAKVEE